MAHNIVVKNAKIVLLKNMLLEKAVVKKFLLKKVFVKNTYPFVIGILSDTLVIS